MPLMHGYHRDGAMRVDGNFGGTLGYEPNSYGEWREQPDFREPPLSIEGAADLLEITARTRTTTLSRARYFSRCCRRKGRYCS